MKKFTVFAVLGLALLSFEIAIACLEFPKTIRLENSPFPFSEFFFDSSRFEYKTADGTTNSLSCNHDKGYSWGINTLSASGEKSIYGYEDFKGALVHVDDKEKGVKSSLRFNDDAKGASALFSKETGGAEIILNCSVVNNVKTMLITIKNNDGTVIAEVSAAKMQNTRGIDPVLADGVINFASRKKQNVSFAGCGVAPGASDSETNTEIKQ